MNSQLLNFQQNQKFRRLYQRCFELFPDASSLPASKLNYLHRQWIFPNHFEPMLTSAEELHAKHFPDSDLKVILLASLLHDTGLVYGRRTSSPEGHEERSCQYATKILREEQVSEAIIKQVCDAILATEPATEPTSPEAIVVRNADAYSHLSSMHFFAKAYFSKDMRSFVDWFENKLESCMQKLSLPELIEEVEPAVTAYKRMITSYHSFNSKD